jgi:hypothetical protein
VYSRVFISFEELRATRSHTCIWRHFWHFCGCGLWAENGAQKGYVCNAYAGVKTHIEQRRFGHRDSVSAPQALALNGVLAPDEADDVFVGLPASENEIDSKNEISGLSYGIPRAVLEKLRNSPKPVYWSHTFYRNAQGHPIKVSYAANLEESEALAKRFLKESVIGFDSQ